MTDSISAVGTLVNASANGGTTLSVTPVNVGGILVCPTAVVTTGINVTGLSGGGVTTWQRVAGPYTTLTAGATLSTRVLELWWGQITTAGASTITFTYSGSVTTVRTDRLAQEFKSTAGASSVWSADGSGGTNTSTTSGTSTAAQFPTLTASRSNRLYVGYGPTSGTSTGTGASSGYIEQLDFNQNPFIYNVNVWASQSPTITQSPAGAFENVAALLMSGTDDTPDTLRSPVRTIQVP